MARAMFAASVVMGVLAVGAGATLALDPPSREHRVIVRGQQVRFCVRGMCAGPERWARQSLRNHRQALDARREIAELKRRLARARSRVRRLQVRAAARAATPGASAASVDWRAKQIAAAEVLGRESAGDPWPNCPDPFDGSGASWDDTAACENGGNWLDSPGYYRCGLQFDPGWERRFGRLCP